MILLSLATQSLQIVLAGAVTTNQPLYTLAYGTINPGAGTCVPAGSIGATNNTTPVTILTSPTPPAYYQVNFLSIYNADTAPVTVTVNFVDSAATPTTSTLVMVTLAVGSTLQYENSRGFSVIDANGNLLTKSGPASIGGYSAGDVAVDLTHFITLTTPDGVSHQIAVVVNA